MPELVCDTSALIALHQVSLLHILPALSPSVLVPTAVEQEIAAGRLSGHDVPNLAGVNWITISKPTAKPALPDAHQLGPGESEVMWLALETQGSCAVLDEITARRVAGQLGIAFTGTLGLLIDAKNLGIISTVSTFLDELDRHEFHTSPRLREIILKSAGELH